MAIAALVLGIIGGIFGLIGGIAAMGIGGLGLVAGVIGGLAVAGLGLLAVLISIYAIVAAALALKKPKFSGLSMLISGIAGLAAINAAYIIAGPLLIAGGVLALVAANNAPSAATATDGSTGTVVENPASSASESTTGSVFGGGTGKKEA